MTQQDETQPLDPRVALAAERTLLAWMRTGLAMMGFGFVVARFGLFLREIAHVQNHPATGTFSRWMGISLVLLGVVLNGFAAFQHWASMSDNTIFDRRRRVSGWVAVGLTLVLAILGFVMAWYLFIMN